MAVLFALVWVYHPYGGWNVNTRLNLVFALVERHSFAIDDYHEVYETGDKAFFNGHFYSDKIIGLPLLAAPAYWVGRTIAGESLSYPAAYFLSKAFAVALPGAVSALLFWLLAVRTGTPPRRAVVLTAFAIFGTMWFGYGTIFYPYVPALACVLGAVYLTLFPPAGRLTVANCLAVGGLLGYALLCDMIFGLSVFGAGVIWLLRLLDQGGVYGQRAFAQMRGDRSRLRFLALLGVVFWVGVLVPLSIFFAYTYSIFGTVAMPYRYEYNQTFQEGMSGGLFGVQAPNLAVMYFILIHPFRGLFFWSPVVLAGLVGCVLALRQYGKRFLLGAMGLWCFVAYVIFNAGYYMWWGGWGMGPRFLIPMLPWVMLGAGELARTDKLSCFHTRPGLGRAAWGATVLLGVAGLLLSGPLSLFDPQQPNAFGGGYLLEQEVGFGTPIPVRQWVSMREFYTLQVTVWPWRRFGGEVLTNSKAAAASSILAFLAIVGALLAAGWRCAPVSLPGTDRNDYPFRTMDGTAAPPPPRRKAATP